MIDTDKYKGHDLAKGRVGSDYNIYDRKGNIIFDADDVGSNMATLNLLADTPLLLAEVKRLREEMRITQSNFSMVRNALANQYPEIEEAIWKVIE